MTDDLDAEAPEPADPDFAWTVPGMRPSPEAAPRVLGHAFRQAADELRLSRADQGRLLGLSAPTITRLHRRRYELAPRRKEWEHALLLVRCYRSLRAIFGGDFDQARLWFIRHNRSLRAAPIDLVTTSEGLVRVTHYLDAVRAGR